MAKLSAYKTDTELKEKGVWVPLEEGLRIRIARAGHPKCKEMSTRLLRKVHKLYHGAEREEETIRANKKVIAKHILVDWENLDDEDGKPIEYSSEKAYEILNNPEYEDFYKLVLELSTSSELFRKETLEDELKN